LKDKTGKINPKAVEREKAKVGKRIGKKARVGKREVLGTGQRTAVRINI